jgi:Pregnancy-associated plasma protein-A
MGKRRRQCATMQVYEELAEQEPSYRANQIAINEFTERNILSGRAQQVTRRKVTIPVVVHVVYKRAAENISKTQINSQLKVLNDDFNARNADVSSVPPVWGGLVGNAKIEFKLAKRDPNGKQTEGITRTKTKVDSFPPNGDPVKRKSEGGVTAWPAKKYLNIWVCNLSANLLGYAQFPGGPARTDGVVILHSAFGNKGTVAGPFNLGRTATHEVGHWLNLRHIWADTDGCGGSDFVADTPNAATANIGVPTFPHISCNNGPDGDMFVNYMDYTDDRGMFMFTAGQVTRMNACLAGPRKSLL